MIGLEHSGHGAMQTFTVVGDQPAADERYLVRALFRPLAEFTVSAARPLAGRRVLDVACGPGIVARVAASGGAVRP